LSYYKGSIENMVKSIYPLHSFPPIGENIRNLMEYLAEEFRVHSVEDWYSVLRDRKWKKYWKWLKGKGNGSIVNILQSIYKDTSWKPWKFHRISQRQLKYVEFFQKDSSKVFYIK
jgi:hypothetical protein